MTEDDPPDETLAKRMIRLQGKARSIMDSAADMAAKAGYIRVATDQMASNWRTVEDESRHDPSLLTWVASGHAMAGELERGLDAISLVGEPAGRALDLALPLFSAASANSIVTASSLTLAPRLAFQPCPFLADSSEELYAAKLTALDPALGGTYRAAWSNNYNQRHDEGRAALFGMRQVYDHFFQLLAPDAAVRSSIFWRPKEEPHPDAVHRPERLTFAAHQWISSDRRTTLLESAKPMKEAYRRLNAAHDRGALDGEKARDAFRGMDAVIRRWVDEIDPWPPDIRRADPPMTGSPESNT